MQPLLDLRAPAQHEAPALQRLPLLTLYLSERCNSRCGSCDYWRHGKLDLDAARVAAWLPSLRRLGTQVVLISGGEPLLHPDWAGIATRLREAGLRLWLLSAGLSLAKHAAAVSALFESVTVSMDGSDAASYAALRGVDAFEVVCEGIRAVAARGLPVHLRCTVQRANFSELPALVDLARRCGARSISFLAADVAHPQAFGRHGGAAPDIALRAADLPRFEAVLAGLERTHAADFASGFILESPAKLRRLAAYFRAVCGEGEFPPVRCNAPQFSAVVEAGGALRPCFFIAGAGAAAGADLDATLNSPAQRQRRGEIRAGQRPECARCVCSMWREPEQLERLA